MSLSYFQLRNRFDFSKHTLDIGLPLNPIWKWRPHLLKHLFNRIRRMEEGRIEEFYRHHLNYFLENNPELYEETFFKHLRGLIQKRLETLDSKDIYDKDHIQRQLEITRLSQFMDFLTAIDRWKEDEPKDDIILRQETAIYKLSNEVAGLKEELKKVRALETEDQIRITDGNLLAFIDLCLQAQDLKLDDGREFLFSQTQTVWVKFIAKHFKHGNNPINPESIRRYFPADKKEPGIKYAPIPSKSQLFSIVPAKKRS